MRRLADGRRRSSPKPGAIPVDHERAVLRHDLEVHQEELRAQNEKLIATLQELEETRDRYVELYDSAPSGYCTLDHAGLIVEINLTAAALLGRPRAGLVGVPLIPTILADDRARFLGYLRSCAKRLDERMGGEEVRVYTARGERVVRLSCRPRRDHEGALIEYFMALDDVTERRRLEGAREEARRAHADLVRRMLTLQEAERHRIARDIHDDLGQQVTALRLKLEWLAGALGTHADLPGAVAAVQDAARRVDQHIDFLLKDLRPAGLDELGLITVLRQAVEDWSATFGIKARFRTSGLDGVRFPPEVETQAFRIAQEALNNVHKHAAATAVDVVVERKQGRTTLCVEDNGIGLLASSSVPAPGGGRRGLGVLGMRERATVIGGELAITSDPGRGTKITLLLP
ncbi:MAG: ATP-binding protein [Vicinamibacteraceae bacterium]